MKLSPLQAFAIIVILIGIVYGAYSATMDQLPDLSGTVVGNTTSSANTTNQTIGTVYIDNSDKNTENISIIITKNTKIYKEGKDNNKVKSSMKQITNGCTIDVYTIGDYTNTIPPQITAEEIVIKNKK